jgi:hypothetical protein
MYRQGRYIITLVWFGLVLMVRQSQPSWFEELGPPASANERRSKRLELLMAQEAEHRRFTVCVLIDSMILPQVHLRKPCYDFSFL